jgi:hypothetical protein
MAKTQARVPITPCPDHSTCLLRRTCGIAGARSLIDDARVGLAGRGVITAVRRHDTPAIFDWLIEAVSYQGVSDRIAYSYMEQHGRVCWYEIAEALDQKPSCLKLTCTGHSRAVVTGRAPVLAPTRPTSPDARCLATICATGG